MRRLMQPDKRRIRSAMKPVGNYMAAVKMSTILRVGSNRTCRFRSSVDIFAAAKARL